MCRTREENAEDLRLEEDSRQALKDAVANAEETLADAMDDTSALDRGEIIELREELARARKALEAA